MIVFTMDDIITLAVWGGVAILFVVLWVLDWFGTGRGKKRRDQHEQGG